MKPSFVKLHPHSFKYLAKGHPWVTKDSFTQRFPKDSPLLLATDNRKKQSYLLLNDPWHPQVAARLWQSQNSAPKQVPFEDQLRSRILEAYEKRKNIFEKAMSRQNLYLVFGEADAIPGLHILKLGDNYLIQYYSKFWHSFEDHILECLKEIDPKVQAIWSQTRGKKIPPKQIFGNKIETLVVSEFEVNYELRFNQAYDVGIYTDMASIREKILQGLPKDSLGLNLFCYTGAFSLAPIKHCRAKVTSVDLARPYLDWLEKNIELNSIDKDSHQSVESDCQKYLGVAEPDSFDWIICDPPTSSSNKKKRTNSFEFYKENFAQLLRVVRPGGKLYLFLNTHSINRRQFKERINELISESKLPIKISEEFALSSDCPRLRGFPEGDYLKGLVLTKPKKSLELVS